MSQARPRLDSMQPSRPGPTRTADPTPPRHFPARGRYRAYMAFGLSGFFLMMIGFTVLRAVWALGDGEAAWDALMKNFENPLYVVFHLVAMIWLAWFALRLFSLFPKTQPFRMGPFQRPPDAVMVGGLTGLLVIASIVVVAIHWGGGA